MGGDLTSPRVEKPLSRDVLMALEHEATKMGDPTDWELYTSHMFAPGVYARRFDLPTDSLVIGKLHRHAHLNFLLSGVVRVASEFHIETFAAPRMWVSEPGIKRAVYTLEDAIWVTIHPNPSDTEDLDEIESEVIAPTYAELDRFLQEKLEAQ